MSRSQVTLTSTTMPLASLKNSPPAPLLLLLLLLLGLEEPFMPTQFGFLILKPMPLLLSCAASLSQSHEVPNCVLAEMALPLFDPMVGDINGNHIGIDVNTVVSVASVDVVSRGIDLTSGREITAWIEYRDAIKMIRVWVGYSSTRPPTPLLVAQIDLSKQFKEFMRVGFSASNGQGSSIHIVDRWKFKTLGLFHLGFL
ncbi:unnamed protein product [Prunus armeniaca]|uniref:Legume lectin domain-containing protein n=1 Tax=Prunus armeniaca TaxID=36596 RepID=A0A6J5VNF8_PRUAR|nr:unnamed protein product [Prunus armeniaca]